MHVTGALFRQVHGLHKSKCAAPTCADLEETGFIQAAKPSRTNGAGVVVKCPDALCGMKMRGQRVTCSDNCG